MAKTSIKKAPIHTHDAHVWAMLCHLSGLFSSYFLWGIGVIAPFVIWLIKRHSSPLIMENGKSAINFWLSLYLYTFLFGTILMGLGIITFYSPALFLPGLLSLSLGGLAMMVISCIISIVIAVLVIVASIDAWHGKVYRYPFTIRFLK